MNYQLLSLSSAVTKSSGVWCVALYTCVHTGFHEGVADILSLAVGTATYFQKLGLLSPDLDISDEETNINILFDMALERIAFLPFGYLVDKYRWDVYSGVTSKAWIPSCSFD